MMHPAEQAHRRADSPQPQSQEMQREAPQAAAASSEDAAPLADAGPVLTATAAPTLPEAAMRRAAETGDASLRTPAAAAPPPAVLLCWLAGGLRATSWSDEELAERLLAASSEVYED